MVEEYEQKQEKKLKNSVNTNKEWKIQPNNDNCDDGDDNDKMCTYARIKKNKYTTKINNNNYVHRERERHIHTQEFG